jgi:hypothetical protein
MLGVFGPLLADSEEDDLVISKLFGEFETEVYLSYSLYPKAG